MNNSLSSQIKKVIGYRILFCFFIAILAVFLFALKEIGSSSGQLENSINQQCKDLESFIVSQILVKNEAAISPKLDSLNQKNQEVKFYWRDKNTQHLTAKMYWKFPLAWTYFYPVKNVDESPLGTLIAVGPLLNDHGIFSDLLTKIASLILFFLIIFIVLYPLSKKIPERLFIKPINNLLALLRNEKNIVEMKNFPEEINEIYSKIAELLKDAEKRSHEAALGQVATQVAHDIRSPLFVLKRVLSDVSSLPEQQRIAARNAIQRVTDIANNLLAQYKHEKNDVNVTKVLSLEPTAMMLESIVSEQRIQVVDLGVEIELDISANAYDAFVQVDTAGFKRVLSNLMNNAVDATKEKKGKVSLTLKRDAGYVMIMVKDNGVGIPKDQLPTILNGVSVGKKEGFGLGLPYAVNKISEWQGGYSLTSEPNEGTQFEIILPESKPADWFQDKIYIKKNYTVIILDDDDYIHQIWNERFQSYQVTLKHFNDPDEFIAFCGEKKIEETIFLLDYELGKHNETGLSLAAKLNIGQYATLVTSRYEDDDIRVGCKKLGMKIIPKFFAETTPICFFSPTEIVFVDDEEVIGEYWKDSAEMAGKSISIFKDPRDFMRLFYLYPKEVLIYMDSSLNDGLKGEDFAKLLYGQGYQNIILATGFPKDHFKDIIWIKDVVGKDPPWK